MDKPPRPRRKPLQTYGKRASSTPELRTEAPLKRRRTESPKLLIASEARVSVPLENNEAKTDDGAKSSETTSPIRESSISEAPQVIKRGSIMKYFKPMPSSSSSLPSSPKTEDQPTSTPPSSPPVLEKAKRKPRILKFRSTSLPLNDGDETEGEEEQGDGKVNGSKRKRRKEDSVDREPLTEQRESLTNISSPEVEELIRKKAKPKATSTVQTTLNISTQAAFSECKVCDTVWNPLYPDDVKYHTKRHASVLRAKKKELDDKL